MEQPFVSVIIPTFNRERPLCQTLRALFLQDYPRYEIIVIDQSPRHSPDTLQFLRSNENKIRYYHLDEIGLPKARNFGVRQAKGEIILFCDDDTIPISDFIRYHAVNYWDSSIGGVAGQISLSRSKPKPFTLFGRQYTSGKIALSGRFFYNWDSDKKRYVFSACGANMSFRKDLFLRAGGFDTFFIGTASYEDADFAYRIRRLGFRIIYEPKALVIHQFYPTGGCREEDTVKEEYFRFHNAMLFYLKNMNKAFLPYMSAIFLFIAVKKILIPTKSFGNFIYVLKGLWDGFRVMHKPHNISERRLSVAKKILLICPFLPQSYNSGNGINFFHTIRTFPAGSEVTLVSFVDDKSDSKHIDSLRPYCSSIYTVFKNVRFFKHRRSLVFNALRSIFTLRPYHINKFYSRRMRELIKRLIKNEKYLDIFVIDIGMAQYVKDYTAVRKVLFQPYIESLFYDEYKNTISNIAMKCLVALESAKLRKQEQSIMNKFDEIVTVTQKDANFLGARLKDPSKCIYRTTGIDTDYFTPRQEDPGTNNILFFGSLYWYPNLDQIRWFLKEIWPPLKGRVPGITVTIIGDGAPRDILRYSNKPGFSVLGYVDDVRPYLRNTALMALPVRICGGGLRTKILVAMASRVPVVSTSLGCAGLGVTHDKDIIIADGEKNFADALEMVIRDTDLRNRLADNGYIFAKENFKWKNL